MPGRILWCSTFSSKTLTPSVSKKTKRLPRPRTLPTLVVCSDSAWDSRLFQVIFNDQITLYWQLTIFIPIVCERIFFILLNKFVFFSAAEILFHCFFGIVAVVFPPKPATGAAATAAAAVGTAALGTGGGGGGGNSSSRPSDDGKTKNSKSRWLNFNSLETSGGKTLHCRTHCEVWTAWIYWFALPKNNPALPRNRYKNLGFSSYPKTICPRVRTPNS